VNRLIKISGFILFMLLLLLNDSSCIKNPGLPSVITAEITNITQTSASSGGAVIDDGGAEVTDSGVCWSRTENPTVANSKISCCAGIGSFISQLTQLLPDARYYARAYATNSAGTGYGNQVSFTTGKVSLAGVLTANASEIGLTSASSGGFIFNDGGGTITSKGVCWSTSHDPTVFDNSANGEFVEFFEYPYDINDQKYSSRLTGLNPGTKYYVRAYITNDAGTAYGYQVSFSTLSASQPVFNSYLTYGTVSDIDGNAYRTIQIGTQTWMAENLKTTRYNDGLPIPVITDNNEWGNRSDPAMCWYDNDPAVYKDLFGAYYNIYAVATEKLCPVGWHVPGKAEWSPMISLLGGQGIAGGKLKETGYIHWLSPNRSATNESGFTALPGGYRNFEFGQIGETANWWSTTSSYYWPDYYFDSYILDFRNTIIYLSRITDYSDGLNIRCLKD
jgi:uncharacterized protein (TIGR02145 family)